MENGADLEDGAVFFFNNHIWEKSSTFEGGTKNSATLTKKVEPKRLTAPPSEVAPFSKTAPGWSRSGSTFFLSARVELSYIP